MPAIGITGGISTGKTTFCDCLRELVPSAKIFNADHAARRLTEFDSDVQKELHAEFGNTIYSPNGHLNRAKLRAIILQSAEKRNALEKILHPRIRREWSAEAQQHRQRLDFFLADIPLLYETGGEALCDNVVVVACSPEIQLARLVERGAAAVKQAATVLSGSQKPALGDAGATVYPELAGPDRGGRLDPITAQQLIKSQMPLEEKIRRADHVVWNNAGRDPLMKQARLLVALWMA
jgi:dephospho-CoA kinase